MSINYDLNSPLLFGDRQATSHAKWSGVAVRGTLGVLQVASARGPVEIEVAIEDLRTSTDFLLPEAILPEIITIAHEMRSRSNR